MKVALASDIHLEIEPYSIENPFDADVLILAGDILCIEDLHDTMHLREASRESLTGKKQIRAYEYRKFLREASDSFKHVVMIAGNHEFYDGRWNASIDHLYDEVARYGNIHFLEQSHIVIEDHLFVGGTLWTDYERGNPLALVAIPEIMNDYKRIRSDSRGFGKLRPEECFYRHKQTLKSFEKILSDHPDKKTIVVSHMAPSSLSINQKYRRDISSFAYHSDLSDFILDHPQIAVWCHGHIHEFYDYTIGDCRVLCNPRGYVGYERESQTEDPFYPFIFDV